MCILLNPLNILLYYIKSTSSVRLVCSVNKPYHIHKPWFFKYNINSLKPLLPDLNHVYWYQCIIDWIWINIKCPTFWDTIFYLKWFSFSCTVLRFSKIIHLLFFLPFLFISYFPSFLHYKLISTINTNIQANITKKYHTE